MLEVLPQVMAEFAKGYSAIGNVSIIGGTGEDGASSVVGGDSAKAMRSVFDSVGAATGLDLAAIIQGQAVGRSFGTGVAQAKDASSASSPAPGSTTAIVERTLDDPAEPATGA